MINSQEIWSQIFHCSDAEDIKFKKEIKIKNQILQKMYGLASQYVTISETSLHIK